MATEAVTEAKIHAIKLSEQRKSQLSIQVNPWQFLQTYLLLPSTLFSTCLKTTMGHFICLCGLFRQAEVQELKKPQ